MATPREKLVALQGRTERCCRATGELLEWTRRLLVYLDDTDLQPTAEQRQRLLLAYAGLRESILGLVANLPADLATFQPDPSEYQAPS